MKLNFCTIILASTLIGCVSNPAQKVQYSPESITEAGSYELRAFFSQDKCNAEIIDEDRGGDESAALLYAVAAPIISETLGYAFKVVSKIGEEMAKPYPVKAYIYPDNTTTILESQCLVLVYGQFGGIGKNNVSDATVPYSFYNVKPIRDQLKSPLGFAMQIKIERNNERLTLSPYNLFYPKQLRPFGVNKYHGISVNIEFDNLNSLSMDFEKLEVGKYYTKIALYSHSASIAADKVTPYKMKITVTEGPDNETLAGLLKAVSSETVSSAEQEVLKTYIDKKIAEKSEKN